MKVTLTWHEVALASQVGMRRHAEALSKGLPDAYGRTSDDGWSVHIEGACGELAVAKAMNVFWSPTVNTFKAGGDVGAWQVRTRSRADYELLVRDSDKDSAPYILVRGKAPNFEVAGWILGADAKQPQWKQTHGGRAPAYFVPDGALKAMAELTANVDRTA